MYKFSLLVSILICNFFSSQIINPYNDEKCQLFKFSTKANNPIIFDFLNDKDYETYKSKKVGINITKTEENKKLLEEFKLKFPKVFEDSCATFTIFQNGKLEEIKSCDVKFKLLDKTSNFYIFEISGFEAHSFLLYNEFTKKAIFTSSFPQILEDGKYIISVNNDINDTIVQYYKINNDEYDDYQI